VPTDPNLSLVSLRDYLEARITALEKANEVASRALEARLAAMNEIRETLRDQSSQMATRRELTQATGVIEKDLRILREFRAELQSKADQSAVAQARLMAYLALAVGIVSLLLRVLGI
jgi:hypothetical protein